MTECDIQCISIQTYIKQTGETGAICYTFSFFLDKKFKYLYIQTIFILEQTLSTEAKYKHSYMRTNFVNVSQKIDFFPSEFSVTVCPTLAAMCYKERGKMLHELL